MSRRRKMSLAVEGAYGSPSYDPLVGMARSLLNDIHINLGGADVFTRDDLLSMPSLSSVSTISRYRYICGAVDILLRTGDLVAKSRTDLVTPGRAKLWPGERMHEVYGRTVEGIVDEEIGVAAPFGVMNVVALWVHADRHLTVGVKRTVVRTVLRQMARAGTIERSGYDSFTKKGH